MIDTSNAIAEDLPGSFVVDSFGQWDGLTLMANPDVSNEVIVATINGPGALAFSYGESGKAVLLSSDTLYYNAHSPEWSILMRNVTAWTAPSQ